MLLCYTYSVCSIGEFYKFPGQYLIGNTVRHKILTNFQQFVNIFPIKIFHLVSYLYEMNEMNTLAFINFLLVKLFPTLIHQNFPLSKICAIQHI